jgi:hypothetical protein
MDHAETDLRNVTSDRPDHRSNTRRYGGRALCRGPYARLAMRLMGSVL